MRIYLNGDTPEMEIIAENTLEFLSGVDGPIEFALPPPPPVEQERVMYKIQAEPPVLIGGSGSHQGAQTWDSILKGIMKLRRKHEIPSPAYLFNISAFNNDRNWFSFGDGQLNHYIHGMDWEEFTGAEAHFPVAYLIASNTLMAAMYDDQDDLVLNLHRDTIGCISDLCLYKRDITLKMRTADVCQSCMNRLKTAIDKHRILGSDAQHLIRIMEVIRGNLLFRSRFVLDKQLSRISIRGYKQEIFLADAGDIKVQLNPMQRAIYLALLHHPDGINPYDINTEPLYSELCERYARVSGIDNRDRIRESVRSWASPETFNIHVSRLRTAFRRTLGVELAEPYLPITEEGIRKVTLDRSLVSGLS